MEVVLRLCERQGMGECGRSVVECNVVGVEAVLKWWERQGMGECCGSVRDDTW